MPDFYHADNKLELSVQGSAYLDVRALRECNVDMKTATLILRDAPGAIPWCDPQPEVVATLFESADKVCGGDINLYCLTRFWCARIHSDVAQDHNRIAPECLSGGRRGLNARRSMLKRTDDKTEDEAMAQLWAEVKYRNAGQTPASQRPSRRKHPVPPSYQMVRITPAEAWYALLDTLVGELPYEAKEEREKLESTFRHDSTQVRKSHWVAPMSLSGLKHKMNLASLSFFKLKIGRDLSMHYGLHCDRKLDERRWHSMMGALLLLSATGARRVYPTNDPLMRTDPDYRVWEYTSYAQLDQGWVPQKPMHPLIDPIVCRAFRERRKYASRAARAAQKP